MTTAMYGAMRGNVDITPDLPDLGRPLTGRERRQHLLGPVLASPFDSTDRLFPSFERSGVYDRGQEDAADLKTMLRRDGRVRQLENVLTLPVRSIVPEFREKKGTGARGREAAELCRQNLGPWIRDLVAQGSAAMIFRKAFFEAEWTESEGQAVYERIEWRPPATCQARFDSRTGRPAGFRQQVVTPEGKLVIAAGDELPGWKVVPQPRAIIFTHGTHREPITGTSELDVAYWCWESRAKVLFLLFSFLESQSLPKIVAYGPDKDTAQANAAYLAEASASSVLPFIRRNMGAGAGGDQKLFDLLESSGKGAGQFLEVVRYLEEQQTQSVLAGFLDLTSSAKSGGSYALSGDARSFFERSRQADADEQARQIASEVCKPLVAYNLGDPDLTPDVKLGPLAESETDRALELLSTLAVATQMNVPWDFLDDLTVACAAHVGLDPDKVSTDVKAHAKERAQQEADAQAQAAAAQAGGQPAPPTDPAAAARAGIGAGIDAAFELTRRVELGQDPTEAQAVVFGRERRRGPNPGGTMPSAPPIDLAAERKTGGADADRASGGMVALQLTDESRRALLVDHPNAEAIDELHLTLLYIGPDVTWWDQQRVEDVRGDAERIARGFEGAVTAHAASHCSFNPGGGPDGDKQQCSVYLLNAARSQRTDNEDARDKRRAEENGDDPMLCDSPRGLYSDPLQSAHSMLDGDISHRLGKHAVEQFVPYLPHITAGYDLPIEQLTFTGQVEFDRVSLHLAGQRWDFPLADYTRGPFDDDDDRPVPAR